MNSAGKEKFDTWKSLVNEAFDAVVFDVYNNWRVRVNPPDTVDDHRSYDNAVYCAAAMQKKGVWRGEAIGVIDPNIPRLMLMGNLSRGETVLFKDERDGTASVLQPYSPEHLATRNDLIFGQAIVNVPIGYLRPRH